MNTSWAIETHGDPLGTVQNLVREIWKQSDLAGMVVSINGDPDSLTKPRLITNSGELNKVNPFKPVMTMNAARLIPTVIVENPSLQYGALLRPCEMRALVEMGKTGVFSMDHLLTICVDCLGTLPADEFVWRAERKKATGGLTQEALQFARQGGILAYRYRSACQTCKSPAAEGADVNIKVLGLPVRQHILIEARETQIAEHLQIEGAAGGKPNPKLAKQHKRVVAKLKERHTLTMERLSQNLIELLPANVDALIEQLEDCGSCQTCMNVCPICATSQPQRDAEDHYPREEVIRWLVSCAGCGMCEQSCPKHLPLNTIFGHIREQLAAEFGYISGQSADDRLPLN